jgi:hypothetical protein
MSYEYLDQGSLGHRVYFRVSEPSDDPSLYVRASALAQAGISLAYVNAARVDEREAINSLGLQLETDNPPYDPHSTRGAPGWWRFMDDLETLGSRAAGMIIIIDQAGTLFAQPSSWGFRLIEVWVCQLHMWKDATRPCRLIFQMTPDPAVAEHYGKAS